MITLSLTLNTHTKNLDTEVKQWTVNLQHCEVSLGIKFPKATPQSKSEDPSLENDFGKSESHLLKYKKVLK